MEIQRITRQYDYRIQQVIYDRLLSRREKKFAIKALESQKNEQINRMYSRYSNRNIYGKSDNRNNNRRQDDDRYDYHHDNR